MAKFLNKTLFSDSAVSYDNSRTSDAINMSGLSVYSVIASWTTTAAGATDTFDSAKTASKEIQDLTYTADTAGAAGNSITVQYLDSVKASLVLGDVTFTADAKGSGGNAITIALAGTGFGGQESAAAVGNAITVTMQGSDSYSAKTCNGGQVASKVIQDLTYAADTRGVAGNSITVTYVAAVKATGTVTITDHESLVEGTADTVTIGTTAFTAQVGASTPGAATFTAQVDNDTTAASLAAQINAHATTSTEVLATAVGAVVTIQYLTVGTSGNAYALAYSDEGAAIGATVSGATLAGGTGDVAGSEAVTVSGSDISVLIESGVSTATQIKAAIDGDVSAAALVDVTISGTGSNAQTAVAVQTLTGGVASAVDASANTITINSHGFLDGVRVRVASTGTLPDPLAAGTDYWVRDKTANSFKLAASYGGGAINITDQGTAAATITVTPRGSTAAEIKSACDGGGAGVTSLIDVAGSSSNSQATALATNLAGGLGGAAGSEQVVVSGADIKVYIEDGASTATQIKTKVDAAASAAALVDVAVTGTGSDAQTATAAIPLEGGVASEVNQVANTVTIPSHAIPSGARGRLTTTGTLPAGLELLTDYFVIVVDENTIKFASSYDNAIAGTAIDITDDGSENGVHTFTQSALSGSIQMQVTNDDPESSTITPKWENLGSAIAIVGNNSTSIEGNVPYNWLRLVLTNTGGGVALNATLFAREEGSVTSASGGGGGGDASASNQAAQIALETAIRDRLISGGPQTGSGTASATTQRVTLATDVALPAGANVIGKTGYKLIRATTNFTRPADTTAYATGDAVTNSTSSPTVFQLDLGALGAVNGQAIEIRKLCVVSSVKQSTLPLFNVFLSATTFTATNDNAALDITDAIQEAGGAWFACDVQNSTASNSRVAYISAPQPMILDAADTKLYGTIQAANAYTPASGEKFTIVAWVALL